MDALIIICVLASFVGLVACVVAVSAASEVRRERRAAERDRDYLNRQMTYESGRTLR